MTLKYNWKKYKKIEDFLNKIYENTLNNLSIENKKYAIEFIQDLEAFFYYIIATNLNIDNIIESLSDIEAISLQKISNPKENIANQLDTFPVIEKEHQILIEPYLPSTISLNNRERRRLYLYKGLIKHIINFKSEKAKEFSHIYDECIKDFKQKDEINICVEKGWLLLEEALSQEIAEKILYSTIGKKRPYYSYGGTDKENQIITKNSFRSNLEMFRMFQLPMIWFGQTLNNIGSLEAHFADVIIFRLIEKAMNGYFIDETITEYISRNLEFELFELLYIMVKLVNAEYSLYNNGFLKTNTTKEENDKSFYSFSQITKRLITFGNRTYGKECEIIPKSRNDITGIKILKLVKNNEPY